MKILSSRRILFVVAASAIAPLSAQADYMVTKAGLYDSSTTDISHTASTGLQSTSFSFFTSLGNAVGTSQRYLPNSTSTAGNNGWYYDASTGVSTIIGLTDSLHTSPTGTQIANPVAINASGKVTGTSGLYGTFGAAGTSVWLYTPGGTSVRIGLFGDGYFNTSNNVTNASVTGISTAGDVAGTGNRYNGTSTTGTDAFYYNASTQLSTPIGLGIGTVNASDYLSSTGLRSSTVFKITASGQVAGTSTNYVRNGSSSVNDAFFYNRATQTSTLISPTSAGNGSANISAMNDTVVAGTVFSTTNFSSSDAWAYNIASGITRQVGLIDPSGGYSGAAASTRTSTVSQINTAGNVIGQSSLYTNLAATPTVDTLAGSDAYFFNGTVSTRIGLTDAQHTANPVAAVTTTRANGSTFTSYFIRQNTATFLNDANQVVGTSARYNTVAGTTTPVGNNAWFYSAATNNTTQIGLTDSIHTNSDGLTQSSTVNALNATGKVIGTSNRYAGGSQKGVDAWLYSPTSNATTLIGLTDSVHTASDSTSQNTPSFLSASGLVAGTATRYVSGSTTSNGADVWLYDSNLNQTFTLTPSLNAATGFASATVGFLGEDGLVLGTFIKNPNATNTGTLDLFAYREGQSIIDLGATAQDLTVTGWASLASMFAGNSLGSVAASGLLNGEPAGSSAGLIFSSVPEPTSLSLLALGAAGLFRKRRRV